MIGSIFGQRLWILDSPDRATSSARHSSGAITEVLAAGFGECLEAGDDFRMVGGNIPTFGQVRFQMIKLKDGFSAALIMAPKVQLPWALPYCFQMIEVEIEKRLVGGLCLRLAAEEWQNVFAIDFAIGG
jgi:hypothetical protein